jgi:hypothetical protein
MKSAILEKGEEFYTRLGNIFSAIDNEQIKYNWLITYPECFLENNKYENLFSQKYVWLEGKELTRIIKEEDIWFIWAVFSGFEKDIRIEEILKYDLPYADGYGGFWIDDVGIQHPLAKIEIVAWDGLETLFISKKDDLVDKFRHYFPLSEDLSAQNTRDNSEIAYIEKLLKNELVRRSIEISKEILHKKYSVWNHLYSDRKNKVSNEDIVNCINKTLDGIKL